MQEKVYNIAVVIKMFCFIYFAIRQRCGNVLLEIIQVVTTAIIKKRSRLLRNGVPYMKHLPPYSPDLHPIEKSYKYRQEMPSENHSYHHYR